MNDLKQFLSESKTFAGVTFSGLYTMEDDVFFKIYDHYLRTGENLLDAYSKCYHLFDEDNYDGFNMNNDGYEINDDDYAYICSCISKVRSLQLFDADKISNIRNTVKVRRDNYKRRLAYLDGKRRRDASLYIAKKEIRDAVFELYGRKCLCCNATTNLSIDHVIPVCDGGVDDISNLQPLCCRCNSKKGSNHTDFRP